jgi:hypothetical protein
MSNGTLIEDLPSGLGDRPPDAGAKFSFWLVIAMLIALFALLLILLVAPLIGDNNTAQASARVEYFKTTMSVLLGAFGAWIGAGAAHFFGRENMKESSISTERALSLQGDAMRGSRRRERIRDLTLTAMNNEFMFDAKATKDLITTKLKDHVNYWFVPALDATKSGVLRDVVHARVFWDSSFAGSEDLDTILSRIDQDPKLDGLRRYRGDAFFLTVSPDDAIADVAGRMNQKQIEVGIVVDAAGRPTHCFTQAELKALQSAQR